MGKRVTIQQIAEMAGVSRGTVDRVLNHRSYVSEAVRARVEAAVAETGYISPREAYRREQDGAVRPLTLGILLPNWTGQFQEEVQEGIRQAEQELAPQHVRILQRRCRTELPQESVELLDEMVREINVTQVAEEEVLSSHAYLYRRSTGMLCGRNAGQNGRAAG